MSLFICPLSLFIYKADFSQRVYFPLIYSNIFRRRVCSSSLLMAFCCCRTWIFQVNNFCFFYLLESHLPDVFRQCYTKDENDGRDLHQCRQLLIILKFSKDSVTAPALSLQLSPPTFGQWLARPFASQYCQLSCEYVFSTFMYLYLHLNFWLIKSLFGVRSDAATPLFLKQTAHTIIIY